VKIAIRVLHLGRRSYAEVAELQERTRARILAGETAAETVFLVEHLPVVTVGQRRGEHGLRVPREALIQRGIELSGSSRGGEATYHGPGQLVVYPVIRLRRGIVAHVEALAGAAVTLARLLGIDARYERARPGVWVGDRKLASIGVHVRRRVAIHGMALNVTEACLGGFSAIVPCGMPDVTMTALARETDHPLTVDAVEQALGRLVVAALDRPASRTGGRRASDEALARG
jgi:lipoate-protein ligase B